MTLPRAWACAVEGLKNRRWWAIFILALTVWILEGLLAALIQGNQPRVSHLYKAILALTAVVGYQVLPSFDSFFWRKLILGALLGAGIASSAGYMQYNQGLFPMERMLMSEAEKTDTRHYRGQLYIPGTHTKAATGPLRNRIKTSVTLVWLFGLLAGLSLLAKTLAQRMGLLGLVGLAGVFSFYTFAKAGFWASVLCLCGVLALHWIPVFRKTLLGVLTLTFVLGMAFVITTGASYPADAKVPLEANKISVRGFAWSHGLKVVQGYPLFGAGLGTYSRASREFFLEPELAFSYTINSHCQHLTAWAEGGLPGGAAWLSIVGLMLWALQRSWLREPLKGDSGFSAQRMAVTFILVAVFLLSFVHDFLFHPSVAALFWMLVGLAGKLALKDERDCHDS